jgi:hypothetical protein
LHRLRSVHRQPSPYPSMIGVECAARVCVSAGANPHTHAYTLTPVSATILAQVRAVRAVRAVGTGVRCPMPWMRSTQGTFYVEIPERFLTTLELDLFQLGKLIGTTLATEYIRDHDSIVIWDWFGPYEDPYYGLIAGGWHGRRGWRVQYMHGRFAHVHLTAPPRPVPIQLPIAASIPAQVPTAEATPAPTAAPTPVPTVEPTPAPAPPPPPVQTAQSTRAPMPAYMSQYQ